MKPHPTLLFNLPHGAPAQILSAPRPQPRAVPGVPARTGALAPVTVVALVLIWSTAAQAATVLWNYSAGDRNWSTAANWTGGSPASTNAVIFGPNDAQTTTTPVNTVDASVAVGALSYTNMSLGAYAAYQNTLVASGQTLTITSNLIVGVGNNTGYTSDPYTYATIVGTGGAVAVTGGNVQIGHQAAANSGQTIRALLDMRGLDSFSYSNAAGTLSIAAGTQRRQSGEVYLGSTNGITAAAISLGIGAAGYGSSAGKLHLGQANILSADTIIVGRIVPGNLIDFQTGLTDATVKIRARDGVGGVANWYTGQNNQGNQSSSSSSGTNDFSGGILDAVATNLYVGYFSAGVSTGGRTANGTFIIGPHSGNSLVVQNLVVGSVSFATATSYSSSIGVFDVRGGSVTAGTVTLAQQLGASVATGTLSLNNATMQVSGDLTEGGGTSTIASSNATLNVTGRVGTPATTVNTLNLNRATLGLTLVAPGDYTRAAASVDTLNVDGPAGSTVLKINNPNPAPGQYPLIAYNSLGGAIGFEGLSVQAPAGTTATLVNNLGNYPFTIDVLISADVLAWNGLPNGNWDLGTTANWLNGAVPTTYTETGGAGKRVRFDDTAAGTTSVSLTTTLSPLGAVVNNTNKDYTFGGSGKLSGTTGLIKQGPGTLTLANTGANDYSGATVVGGGKLQVGTGGTAGTVGPGPVIVDGTLEFNRSDDLVITNALSGGGGLSKPGANSLTLAGPTTYSGPTAIGGGTLALSPTGTATLAGNVSGVGRLALTGAGTLVLSGPGNNYSGGTLISSGTLQIGDGLNQGSLAGNVTNNGRLVFNSSYYNAPNNITGTGGVSSIGLGCTFTLAGVNTYTGPTLIQGNGTLSLGAASALPAATVLTLGDTSGPAIGSADFTAYSPVVGGLTVGGNQTLANTITLSSGQSLTVNGNFTVGNTLGSSAKANLAFLAAGASLTVNTNGGVIQIGLTAAGAGGSPNSVNCDLTGLDVFTANLGTNGILRMGDVNGNTGNGYPLSVLRLAPTSTLNAGTLGVGVGGKQFMPELHLGSLTNTLNADVINIGAGASRDSGKLVFEGPTGAVRIRGSGGAATRASLNLLVGATTTGGPSTNVFDVSGHYADLLFGSLVIGEQAGRVGGWTNYFGFDQGILDAATVSLSKACRTGTTGGSLLRLGGGTVNFGTFALASSSAAGMLDITGGQVTVSGDLTKTGTGVGTLSLASATLRAKGAIGTQANPLDVLVLDTATLSLAINSVGNPTSAPVHAVSFSANNTCHLAFTGAGLTTGQFPLIAYTGSIGGGGFLALTLVNPPGVSAALVDNSANGTVDVLITAITPLVWTGTPNGNWDIAATANWQLSGSALSYTEAGGLGDRVLFDDTAPGATTVNLTATLNPSAISLSNSVKNYTFSGSGRLSGDGGLAKQGSGSLTLANTGSNDFTGVVSIAAGTLQVGNGGTAGNLGSGPVVNGDRLVFNRTDDLTVANFIGGTGALEKQTANTLTLTGPNTYSGPTTIAAGTLQIADGGSLGTGNVTNHGALVFSRAGTLTLAGDVSGTGSLAKLGTSTLVLTGNNHTYGGGTRIAAGTLQVGNADATGSLPTGAITNDGTLYINTSNNVTLTGPIGGLGLLSKHSWGVLTLSASNSFAGPVTTGGATEASAAGFIRLLNSYGLGGPLNAKTVSVVRAELRLEGGLVVPPNITFFTSANRANGAVALRNVAGTNTLEGNLVMAGGGGYSEYTVDAGQLVLNGAVGSAAPLRVLTLNGVGEGLVNGPVSDSGTNVAGVLMEGPGQWTLAGANSYSGATTVSNGTLLVNGTVGSGTNTTLVAGGTLGGNVSFKDALAVLSGGTLAPGASIGTMTASNTVSLAGTTVMEVNKTAGTQDQLIATGTLTYGGTLVVSNLAGALAAGDSFQLFPAGTYRGAFTDLVPATPGAGLQWDTNSLAVNGTLNVVGGAPPATNLTLVAAGPNAVQLSGLGGANQAYGVYAQTNVATPMAGWWLLGTTHADGSGLIQFLDAQATNGQRYYRFGQ